MIFINKKHTNIHLKLTTGSSDHKMISLETNKETIRKELTKSFAGALFDSPTHLSNLNNLINTQREVNPDKILIKFFKT